LNQPILTFLIYKYPFPSFQHPIPDWSRFLDRKSCSKLTHFLKYAHPVDGHSLTTFSDCLVPLFPIYSLSL
jgi:hypothetical protein